MKPHKLLLAIIALAWGSAASSFAQNETEPVQTQGNYGTMEEYSVLKADKTVRQGSYAKYRIVRGPRNLVAMLETGNYERGQKEGEWRTFFSSPYNKLSSKGSYHVGLPEGQWYYYHEPKPSDAGRAVPTGKNPKESLSIDLEDTSAVVKAKGLCHLGAKVGLWKYYNERSTLVQAVNESANRLMYWQPTAGPSVSGDAATSNHPLLYVGGKDQLLHDLADVVNGKALLRNREIVLKKGQTESSDVVISVDSTGHQTNVALATNPTAATKYSQFILTEILSRVSPRWVPQVVNGKAVAAEYHIMIKAEKLEENTVKMFAKFPEE